MCGYLLALKDLYFRTDVLCLKYFVEGQNLFRVPFIQNFINEAQWNNVLSDHLNLGDCKEADQLYFSLCQ